MSGGGPQPPFTRQFPASPSSSTSRGVVEGSGQQQQQQTPQQEQQVRSSSQPGGCYYPPPPPQGFTGTSEMGGGSGYPAAPGGVYAMPAPAAGGGGPFMIPAYPMGAYGPGKNMASPIMGNVLPAMGGHQQQHPHQQGGGGGGLGFNSRGGMQQLRPHNRRGGMPGSSKQLVHFDESLAATQTVDRAIVSALKQPQHRLLLLEIEPAIHKMITETDSERLKLTNPLGKYQRMLIHKLGDYFRMDREVDYAKGSDMCTVTLVRTERTCVPNTILQELCRSALEAAEMADGGQPWPYVPRQQQQQQSHSRQQEESDSNVARRSVERAHSDEGVLEGDVDEHCSDVRGTCSEGGASAEGTPSEAGGDPAAATAGVKRRGVKILRRGPGSKGKNTRASRPDESSSDEGGKYSEANLLHNLPVDLREEHYNKIRAKIFQEDDGTPLVYSNEDLAAMESARKHIPKGTDLDDPDYNRQAVSIIPQLGRVQQAPPTLLSDPAAYNAAFPVLGGRPTFEDETRNKDTRRRGGNKRQQQQQQFKQQQYSSNAGGAPYSHHVVPMSPMMPLPPGGAPGTTADAATIAAFQQGYIAATMAAAAAAQQQGVAWTPPPPPPPSINFSSSSQQQQQPKDSLLPIPSGGSPAQFAGYYHQPHGMSFPAEGPTGVQQQQQQQQQWGAALPSPQKGGRGGGGRHGNAQGVGRGNRGGSVQSHHQQGGSRKSSDMVVGSSFPQAGWADPQLPSPQGTPRLQQHQQQPQLDLLRQQGRLLQQQQAQRISQTGLDTISRGEPGSMKSSVAAQGGSDIQSASLAEGSTATPTVGGSTL